MKEKTILDRYKNFWNGELVNLPKDLVTNKENGLFLESVGIPKIMHTPLNEIKYNEILSKTISLYNEEFFIISDSGMAIILMHKLNEEIFFYQYQEKPAFICSSIKSLYLLNTVAIELESSILDEEALENFSVEFTMDEDDVKTKVKSAVYEMISIDSEINSTKYSRDFWIMRLDFGLSVFDTSIKIK